MATTNKYIKKLILETIKANISVSKDKLITESKDYLFTKEDVHREASLGHEMGIPGLYIDIMDVYNTMEEAEAKVFPLMHKQLMKHQKNLQIEFFLFIRQYLTKNLSN